MRDEADNAADQKRLRKFRQFMTDRGFVRDSRGFWLAPGSALATKVKHDNHDIDDNEEEAKP